MIQAFEAFARNPRPGEVYNLGGGRGNSVSMLEAIDLIERASGRKIAHRYEERNRIGDHICYISNLGKLQRDFPEWSITVGLEQMIEEMVAAEQERARA